MSSSNYTFDIGDTINLRPLNLDDAGELFAVVDRNRSYLRKWLPWLDSNLRVEDTRSFIVSVVERGRAGRGAVWGIEHAGALCGVAGFNWIEPSNRICEIGYWLSETHQRRGIVTRCTARLVRHAFEDLNVNRITIPVAVENVRSRAVPERLGFRAEGVLREAEWLYDHYVDHVLYAMVRSEWQNSSKAT
jgi:ribosomal-protein-serine acetyltransferase